MKISIVTICYNSDNTISQTFDSILKQDYKDIEYVVVDGKSTDRTLEIIKIYEKKFKDKKIFFKYISEKDYGIYNAMNKGITLTTGDIVGIINSDDWYEENILDKIAKEFENDSNIGVLYGKSNIVNEKGEIKYIFSPGRLKNIIKTMTISHPTVFVRRKIYQKFQFNENNKIASDYEFLLDNYLDKIKFKEMDKIIANFRIGGESSVQELLGYKEVLEIQKRKGIKGIQKYINYYKKIIVAKLRKNLKKIVKNGKVK